MCFGSIKQPVSVKDRVIGTNDKSIDEVVRLHRLI